MSTPFAQLKTLGCPGRDSKELGAPSSYFAKASAAASTTHNHSPCHNFTAFPLISAETLNWQKLWGCCFGRWELWIFSEWVQKAFNLPSTLLYSGSPSNHKHIPQPLPCQFIISAPQILEFWGGVWPLMWLCNTSKVFPVGRHQIRCKSSIEATQTKPILHKLN